MAGICARRLAVRSPVPATMEGTEPAMEAKELAAYGAGHDLDGTYRFE